MFSTSDFQTPCPNCEYSDLNRSVTFVDEDVYPERRRRCPHCIVYPDAQEMDREPFEDCCGRMSLFYGLCMDCIDAMVKSWLNRCDLCQNLWKTLRTVQHIDHVCKSCLTLYELYDELWELFRPPGPEPMQVPSGPDCQICCLKWKHQFLYAMLQTGRARMCWPCIKVFQSPH